MFRIDFSVIATGSTGNAVLIGKHILIDIGVPYKAIEPCVDDIKLVLLSHQHGDHFKKSTVTALHRRHPAIRWACGEWMAKLLLDAGVSKRVIDVCESEKTYSYGAFEISLQEVPHDVRNCAWMIEKDGKKLFYCTDVATLHGVEAKDFDIYMLEANHTRAEIRARIEEKQAAGEYAYEIRAARNHLSREDAEDWLAANAGPMSKYVLLHQHKVKNG